MGVISGKDLAVNGVSTVSRWKIEVPGEPAEYIASGSQSAVGRQAGIRDWRGIYTQFATQPDAWPGAALTFAGSIDESVGASGTGIIDGVRIVWEQEKASKIRVDTFFSANGDLTLGDAVATDAGPPTPVTSKGKILKLDDVEVTDISEMSLYIFRRNIKYSGSSTPGYYKRVAGDWDAQVEWKQYTDTPSGLAEPFDVVAVKMYTTDTLFYLIEYVVIDLLDDFGADHMSDKPVGAHVRGSFSGFSGTATGEITAPDSTAVWPEA